MKRCVKKLVARTGSIFNGQGNSTFHHGGILNIRNTFWPFVQIKPLVILCEEKRVRGQRPVSFISARG